MNAPRAVRRTERIADWPRISATVRQHGTGSLTINGTERPCTAGSVEELRTGMIARCAAIAGRLRRPVRLTVNDGEATWNLAVRAEGIVQLIDDAGTIPPADGLAVHEGSCRTCRRLQPVTEARCAHCGTDEPHRVEANPIDARDVVPDAAAIDTLEHAVANSPHRQPRPRPTLHLTFSSQAPIDITENIAIGRNPEPVGGRRPVQVVSHERMLSRTHALIDVDAADRIVVTDNHSGNGIEAQTKPPTRLTPGAPYVIHPGTTLLMGDVAVQVNLA